MLRNLRSRSSNSLGSQVITLVSFVLITTLIIFSLSVFFFVNRTEKIAWQGRQQEAARNAAGTVGGFIQRVKDTLTVVSIVEPDRLVNDATELKALLGENLALLELVRTDSSGHVFASASRDNTVLANLITIPQSQWFLQARAGQTYIGNVQLSANNEPYLIMAVPSADGGVVAARVQMDILWNVVQNIQFGRSGEVIVINHAGSIIAHTNSNFVIERQTILGRPELSAMLDASDHEWSGAYTDFHGEQVVATTTIVPGTEWIMITELPESEAFANTKTALIILSIETLILILVASLMALRYVRIQIAEPMEQLRDGAERIGQGDLNHRIHLTRTDEIGQLATAFDSMAADLEKQQGNLEKAIAYEYESQRARELAILLKASEATSSSLELDTVLLTLAAQIRELSGYQSCYISEWDKETNKIFGLVEHSRTLWREDLRDSYSLREYPNSKQVLLTGKPMLIQGDFEAEERQWMNELGRTALIMLALQAQGTTIALVEIATTKKDRLFTEQVISDCLAILSDTADLLIAPLSANNPKILFKIEERLLKASGAEICSFSEWDQAGDRVLSHTVAVDMVWSPGQSPYSHPELEISWGELALQEGKTSVVVRSAENTLIGSMQDGSYRMDVEALIVFPLQKGNERIGMVELYDFNFKTQVTPEQLTLIRTIADKASYWIENVRLLQLTKKRLKEKDVLLKEVHHRVKNNLQMISSLLSLQTAQTSNTVAKTALRESQARVRSMALIHEKLYQSESLEKIDFGEYVKKLATELFHSYRHNLGQVQLKFQMDEIYLDLDHAVSCGLILNELLTNSLKYAFPEKSSGTISIGMHTNPGQILTLRVADDGVGLPSGLDINNTNTLGLKLVKNLVEQLDGNLEVDRSNGTAFQITFEPFL